MNVYNNSWDVVFKQRGDFYGIIVFYVSPDNVAENDKCLIVTNRRKDTRSFPKGQSKINADGKKETFIETAIRKLEDETDVKFSELMLLNNFQQTEFIYGGDKPGFKHYLVAKIKPGIEISNISVHHKNGKLESIWMTLSNASRVLAEHRTKAMYVAHSKVIETNASFIDSVDLLLQLTTTLPDEKQI